MRVFTSERSINTLFHNMCSFKYMCFVVHSIFYIILVCLFFLQTSLFDVVANNINIIFSVTVIKCRKKLLASY